MNPDTPASKPEPPSLDTTEKACVSKQRGGLWARRKEKLTESGQ